MTPEQIAEVIQRANTGGYDGDCIAATKEDVMRILEEREAALNVLREIREILNAAIAFAEAP